MPFGKGQDPREAGRKGGQRLKDVVTEGPLDLLAEMEALPSRPRKEDRTTFQRKLRARYERDFDGYMDQLVRLRLKEPVKKAGGCETPAEGSLGQDEGSERCLSLAEELLKGWGRAE